MITPEGHKLTFYIVFNKDWLRFRVNVDMLCLAFMCSYFVDFQFVSSIVVLFVCSSCFLFVCSILFPPGIKAHFS